MQSWELEHLLLDDVLPKSLSHDGYFVLHAAGLLSADRALVILGDTGRGKSTLTASLGQSGLTMLSDDSLIVTNAPAGPRVEGTYPGMRLLPDSLGALFETPPKTSDVAQSTPKRRLHLDDRFSSEPAPIGALFFLDPPAQDINLRSMTVAEACVGLIANSFALDPADRVRAAIRMQQASALAAAVPAYSLAYPRDYAALPDVHAAIEETLAGILARRSGP